jgi:hypothetical protein
MGWASRNRLVNVWKGVVDVAVAAAAGDWGEGRGC